MNFKKHVSANLLQQRKQEVSPASQTALTQLKPNLGQIPALAKAA